ncbi:MAG TPA: hypothetical protein VD971_01165 [Phycisphaerales bacterium]|nr:hypothetical protein [Phycisphaerales bacterium]
MKLFWAIVLALIVAAAATLVVTARSGANASRPSAAREESVSHEPEAAVPTEVAGAPPPGTAPIQPDATMAGAPAPPTAPAMEPMPTPVLGAAVPTPAAGPVAAAEPAAAPLVDPLATGPVRLPRVLGDYEVLASPVEYKDGALHMDGGKFVVKGAGTREDPLRVPWELLVACEEEFDPASNKVAIPARVAVLHGRFVRLDGYVAFPLMSPKPDELLAMLNQWDGCCIGVPPTPYDAVEVKLRKPATGDDRFAVAGAVTGVFRVLPYVVKNKQVSWLVGLYVMEDADLATRQFGTTGQHTGQGS